MFKIQNKAGPAQWFLRFGNSYFVHLNLFPDSVGVFEFRISASLGNGSNGEHSSRISNYHFWVRNL